jgi:hypothetical protein
MKALTIAFICLLWLIALTGFVQSLLNLRFDTMAGSILLAGAGYMFLQQVKEEDYE